MARQFYTTTSKVQKSGAGNANTDNYSFFAAIKPRTGRMSTTGYIAYNGHGGSFGQGWGLYLQTDNTLQVDMAFVANYNSGLRVIPGRWNGVVYLRRSGVSYMFANGVKSKTTSSSSPFQPQDFYTIGNYANESGGGSDPFIGGIAEPALYSVALTDAEAILLSKLLSKPYNVRRGQLSQYHELNSRQAVEWALVGSSLTPTNAPPYPHPTFGIQNVRRIYRPFPWNLSKVPAAAVSQIKKLSGQTQATLKVVAGVAIAGVKKVSGVANT